MPSPNLEPLPEKPKAPALAYGIMANLLGDDYFTTPRPPVQDCVNLMVVGFDGVPTQWLIHREDLGQVGAALRVTPRVRSAQVVPAEFGMR